MNLKYFIGWTIAWMIIAAFSDCNSCKNVEPITLHAGRNLKATGVFQPGSYWIYTNDSTLQTDSEVVSNYRSELQPVYGPCGNNDSTIVSNQEFFSTDITSVTLGDTYLLTTGLAQPVLYSRNGSSVDTIFIDLPCTDSNVCRTYDTLRVGFLTFYNVRERIDSISNVYEGSRVNYFTANGLGIIKKQVEEPGNYVESWSLSRWHIIQ